MHCLVRLSFSPPRSAAPRLFAFILLLASLLSLAPASTQAASVAASAKLTPRNFVPTLNAQGVLTVAYDLDNTGTATAASTSLTNLSLLSATNVPVGTRQSPATLPAAIADIPAGGSLHLAVTFAGLTAGQRLKFSIAFLASGPVGASTGFYLTVPSAPVVPLTLTAAPGNGAVTLNYSAVPGAASYSIYASTSPSAAPSAYSYVANTSGTSYTQTGLTNGVTYYYFVVPVDGGGSAGTPSSIASALVSLPAPTNLTALPGNGSVTLTFTPAAGLGVDATSVYVSTDPNAPQSAYVYSASTSGTTITQGALQNGTAYYYYVVSHNAGGFGTPSGIVSATPALPEPTTLTATPGNGLVTLNFPSGKAQGVDYTNVYVSTNASAALSDYSYVGYTGAGGTTYTQGGLSNGTTYYYYIRYHNSSGLGVPSAVVSATVSLIAPTALTATPGDGSVTLTFTADQSLGVDYTNIYVSTDPKAALSDYSYVGYTGAGGTTYRQGGLSNRTTYYYYVVHHNAGGLGMPSAVISATPVLPAPTNLKATTFNGSVTLTFTPANGQGVDYTNIYVSTNASAALSDYSYVGYTGAGGTSYTQGGLSNGTTYYYYVVAHNSGGFSDPSARVSVTPTLSAPTNLTAVPGNGSVTLTFTADQDQGVDYTNVYVSTTAGAALADYSYVGYTGAGGTSYTQGGLSNRTTYYYYVIHHNAGGFGKPSVVVSATPSLPAPTGLTATPGNGSVTLNFIPPADQGVDYTNVYVSTNASAALSDYSYVGYTGAGGTSYTQGGLSNGTTYYYYVVSHNSGGFGTPSAVAQATVSLIAPGNFKATPGNSSVTLTFTADQDLGVDYTSVYVSTTAGAALSDYSYVGYTGAGGTSYTQGGLSNGTTYYYYVIHHNAGGNGAPSTVLSAKPIAVTSS